MNTTITATKYACPECGRDDLWVADAMACTIQPVTITFDPSIKWNHDDDRLLKADYSEPATITQEEKTEQIRCRGCDYVIPNEVEDA